MNSGSACFFALVSCLFAVGCNSPRDSVKNTPPDFTGFWKWHCSDEWGVQIKKQTENLFSVSFCGPGGCFEPGTWMPNTPIVGDPKYRYVNPTTLEIQHGDGWQALTKCTANNNPGLDGLTSESPTKERGNPHSQQREVARTIVLPNPQLIHCHSAECSQLWKQMTDDSATVYPAQVLTDVVKGEIVGLTAVYDKSVSTDELRGAIDKLYGKSSLPHSDRMRLWRVEADHFAISLFDGIDGAREITYLKFGSYESHVPAAHLDCKK
jgi:hypothetical protein